MTGPFESDQSGVWFVGDKGERTWLSAPLKILGHTRNAAGLDHGLLLQFADPDNVLHQWHMPLELLADDGREVRRGLLHRGLRLNTSRKANPLFLWFLGAARAENSIILATQPGWAGASYVLPDVSFGPDPVYLYQQTAAPGAPPVAGTILGWQEHVGELCKGNSRLILAVSMALAAPLLYLTGDESGGVHLYGGSSIGKSTASYVAQSVWGPPSGLLRWRSTANALERAASAHNDRLLILDELAQIDPRQAAEVAYMLGNGSGKMRSTINGTLQESVSWRLFYLSNGEITLSDHLRQAGITMKGGQEVRHVDIPADTGIHGILETLHHDLSPVQMIERLKWAANTHYGALGRAWARLLVEEGQECLNEVEFNRGLFLSVAETADPSGPVRRVAVRFGLFFGAAAVAAAKGLLPWGLNEIHTALYHGCFRAWIEARGGNEPHEVRASIAQVREFLARHGESRFTAWDANDYPTRDRAGFRRRDGENGHEYFIFPDVWRREICAGFDPVIVARLLADRNMLKTGEGRNLQKKVRLPDGVGLARCYVLVSSVFQ